MKGTTAAVLFFDSPNGTPITHSSPTNFAQIYGVCVLEYRQESRVHYTAVQQQYQQYSMESLIPHDTAVVTSQVLLVNMNPASQ